MVGAAAIGIDRTRYVDPAQYVFLARTVQSAEIVSLAESIHMTHEFPLVRLGMVRHLNENLGFHVLALEGSSVDAWATQDLLLNSARSEWDIGRAQKGFFPVWDTPEMRGLFRYEVQSWKTRTPLYITAYDIQPGTGSLTRGEKAFWWLQGVLWRYAPAPRGFEATTWTHQLSPLANACAAFTPEDSAPAEIAIEELDRWIAAAAPEVKRKFPTVPHAAALRLIPENLRASLRLCRAVRFGDWVHYKQTRDLNAEAYVQQLKDAAPGGKLLLWAHASHLFYDSSRMNTSVGELLHDQLGPRIYTIGVFAERGGAIMLFSDVHDLIGYGLVRAPWGALRSRVDELCPTDCFMDLRGTQDRLFLTPQPTCFEGRATPLALAKEFDAVVWIKHVHAPDLPPGRFLIMATLAYVRPPRVYWTATAILLCLAGVVVLLRMVVRIGRRRRLNAAPAQAP